MANIWTEARELWIKQIRERGSDEDKVELQRMLDWEQEEEGHELPAILYGRLSSQWMREHTKAYQTPTILKQWKDSLPAPVAVWFFHECDVLAIEEACYFDFCKEAGETMLSKDVIGTCYAYRQQLGEDRHHGTWHQGERAYGTGLKKAKYDKAARVLETMVRQGHPKDFRWGDRFVDQNTKDLQPFSFSGEGKQLLLG